MKTGLAWVLLVTLWAPLKPDALPRIQGLMLHGPGVIPLQDSVLSWQQTLLHHPLQDTLLDRLLSRIHRSLANLGFPEAEVQPWYFTGPPDSLVVHLRVVPGPLRRLRVLKVDPPTTHPGPLRRWFAPALGQVFSWTRLQSLQRGWNQRFGDRIRIDSLRFLAPDTLELFLHPRPANALTGIFSRGPDAPLLGHLTLDFRNLAGSLRVLQLDWTRWRPTEQELRVTYEEPWIPLAWLRLAGHTYLQDTLMQVFEAAFLVVPMALDRRLGLGVVHQRSLWIPTQTRTRETRSLLTSEEQHPRGLSWTLRLEATPSFYRYQGQAEVLLGPPRGGFAGGELLGAGLHRTPHPLESDRLDLSPLWLPFGLSRLPENLEHLVALRLFLGLAGARSQVRLLLEQSHWKQQSAEPWHHTWGVGVAAGWQTPTGLQARLQYTWTPGRSFQQGLLRIALRQTL